MTAFKFAFAAVSATALMAVAGSSLAQAPARPAAAAPRPAAAPAAPAATAISHGPAIPGICIVDLDQILAESAVGKAANTRLQKLQTDVQAEVNAEQTALVNDAKTFQAQRATLAQDAADKKDADLQVRNNALQRKAEQRQQELQATQQKAADRILTEIDPVEAQVYQQRNCSMLSRQGVIATNPAMDITPVVITALNARISTLTFEREHLDQAAAAPQAR